MLRAQHDGANRGRALSNSYAIMASLCPNLFREQYEGIRTFKAGSLRSPSTSHSLVVGGSDLKKIKLYIYRKEVGNIGTAT